MQLLLDTHALLWTVAAPRDLSARAREAIGASDSVVYVSLASLWEIAIKVSIGKLQLPGGFFSALQPAGFELLAVTLEDIEEYGGLPMHHRDPFDRMLVAQARRSNLVLVTRDDDIAKYDVAQLLA